jgi:hypothetical protein
MLRAVDLDWGRGCALPTFQNCKFAELEFSIEDRAHLNELKDFVSFVR